MCIYNFCLIMNYPQTKGPCITLLVQIRQQLLTCTLLLYLQLLDNGKLCLEIAQSYKAKDEIDASTTNCKNWRENRENLNCTQRENRWLRLIGDPALQSCFLMRIWGDWSSDAKESTKQCKWPKKYREHTRIELVVLILRARHIKRSKSIFYFSFIRKVPCVT